MIVAYVSIMCASLLILGINTVKAQCGSPPQFAGARIERQVGVTVQYECLVGSMEGIPIRLCNGGLWTGPSFECKNEPLSCKQKTDIIFILDESSSVGHDDFNNIKDFVKQVLKSFLIDPEYVRVGILSFGEKVRIRNSLRLQNSQTNAVLEMNIDQFIYRAGGSTRTDKAVDRMVQMFKEEGRNKVPQIAVILTDGLSLYPMELYDQIEKATDLGIQFVGVGFGRLYFKDEMNKIVLNQRHRFVLEDFSNITDVTNQREGLEEALCEIAMGANKTTNSTGTSLEKEDVNKTELDINNVDCDLYNPEYGLDLSGLFAHDTSQTHYTDNHGVTISNNKAEFDGNSYLHVNGFSNSEFIGVVKIQFRPIYSGTSREALITNCFGNSAEGASFEVVIDYDYHTVSVSVTNSESETRNLMAPVYIGWDNVMFIIITKERMTFRLNFSQQSVDFIGDHFPIKVEQSGFILGHGCGLSNYHGEMWNMKIFTCIPRPYMLAHVHGR